MLRKKSDGGEGRADEFIPLSDYTLKVLRQSVETSAALTSRADRFFDAQKREVDWPYRRESRSRLFCQVRLIGGNNGHAFTSRSSA